MTAGANHDAAIAALAEAGFDLVQAFDAHALAATHPALAPIGGTLRRLGLLVGNSRALWDPFVAAMRREPALAASAHPLDHYTERSITAAFPGAPVFFGHRRHAGSFLPMQPLAVAIGVGGLAPSHLVIHPTFGPWFALRAVVLLDGEPPTSTPIAKPCTCGDACPTALASALSSSGPESWRAWLAVRDACHLRAARYSDDQIRYHYLKVWRPT